MSKPFMSQKHYEMIANVVAQAEVEKMNRRDLAEHFADFLQLTNPLFKRDRFLKACETKEVENERTENSSSSNPIKTSV